MCSLIISILCHCCCISYYMSLVHGMTAAAYNIGMCFFQFRISSTKSIWLNEIERNKQWRLAHSCICKYMVFYSVFELSVFNFRYLFFFFHFLFVYTIRAYRQKCHCTRCIIILVYETIKQEEKPISSLLRNYGECNSNTKTSVCFTNFLIVSHRNILLYSLCYWCLIRLMLVLELMLLVYYERLMFKYLKSQNSVKSDK